MQLGVIGLGRMGRIVVDRTLDAGHDVVAFDISEGSRRGRGRRRRDAGELYHGSRANSAREKRIWLMVPAGDPIDAALDELDGIVDAADVVVDGGNSNFHDTLRRAERTDAAYVISGTSGAPRARKRAFP